MWGKIIFCFALLLSFATMTAAQSEQACVSFCSQGDYDSAASCYKGTRSRADAYIAVANCALNNNNDNEAEKWALKSAKYRASWATFFLNKIPKVDIKTGGTASSYALAYVATEKESHKENSIKYARTSGQCTGADDVDKCAEAYFNNSVRAFGNRKGITGRNTNPQLAEKTCKGFSEYYSWLKGECKCRKGYADLAGECALDVYDDRLTTETSVELEEAFKNLEPSQATVVEIKTLNKKSMKVGVAKKSDGSPMYSKDGKKWVSDVGLITNKGWTDTIKDGWGSFTTAINPLNWFDAKYKDDKPGQNKQIKYEIAKGVREEFVKDVSDPKSYEEQAWDTFQKAQDNQAYAAQVIQDMIEKGVLDTAVGQTIDSLKPDFWAYFQAFPAEAVKKIAKEATDTDFFQGAYYYIREREAGKSQDQVMRSQPEEMEFAVGVSTVEGFGEVNYWNKLEETYQRYKVWEELKPSKNS